jgi:hypothetical protein
MPAASPTPWAYSRTFGPEDVHGALRNFKLSAPAKGYFFSSRGLRKMFAKYYFNNPAHVTLPQSPRASCLFMSSREDCVPREDWATVHSVGSTGVGFSAREACRDLEQNVVKRGEWTS